MWLPTNNTGPSEGIPASPRTTSPPTVDNITGSTATSKNLIRKRRSLLPITERVTQCCSMLPSFSPSFVLDSSKFFSLPWMITFKNLIHSMATPTHLKQIQSITSFHLRFSVGS